MLLQLTLEIIFEVLVASMKIRRGESGEAEASNVRDLLQTPRQETLLRALRDTAKVLENTKRSFRSKEVAALRRGIVDLLNGADWAAVE